MPRMDRTGPRGQGPMTGGGFGRCGENAVQSPGAGRRMGRGRGAGMGNAGGARRNAAVAGDIADMRQPTAEPIDGELKQQNDELARRLEKANEENAMLMKDNEELRDNSAKKKARN